MPDEPRPEADEEAKEEIKAEGEEEERTSVIETKPEDIEEFIEEDGLQLNFIKQHGDEI